MGQRLPVMRPGLRQGQEAVIATPDDHRAPTDIEVEQLLLMLEQQMLTWKGNPDYLRRLRVEHMMVQNCDRMRRGLLAIRSVASTGEMVRAGVAWLDDELSIVDYCTLLIGDRTPPRRRRPQLPRPKLKRRLVKCLKP